MARKVAPLTNTQIKQARAADKELTLNDGDGLQLRIKTNGSKLWGFKYYHPLTKKRTNISFGRYPEVTLAQAREKRTEARALLAQGTDPRAHREETLAHQMASHNQTFEVFAEKWMALKLQQVKERTAQRAYNSLNKHILPFLGQRPIADIKPREVIKILEPVKVRGNYETIKRLCRYINEIMRLALASGHIEVNYLADVTKLFPAPKKTHMPTLKPEQLPELMQTLHMADIKKLTRCLLEWQLHTMTRPIEAATAKWEEIDLEKKVWVIPADKMKMKKPHTIPLTPQSLALLEYLKPVSGHRPYLFPSQTKPLSHANSQTANMALKRMGFHGKLVSHGLRAIASTTLNEQGFDHDVIEAALAHADPNEVRRAYNRAEYIERRRKMMEWWSEHIEQCASGNFGLANKNQTLRLVNG